MTSTSSKFFLKEFFKENLLNTTNFGNLLENMVKINFAHFSTEEKLWLRRYLILHLK